MKTLPTQGPTYHDAIRLVLRGKFAGKTRHELASYFAPEERLRVLEVLDEMVLTGDVWVAHDIYQWNHDR